MIYQLLKLEYPSSKSSITLFLVLLAGLFSVALLGHIGILVTIIAFIFLAGSRTVGRNMMFEMALPIRGRDIFGSRLLTNLGSFWLLILTIIAAIPFSRVTAKRQITLAVLVALALTTLGIMVIYSVRIPELKLPRWRQQTNGWTGFFVIACLFFLSDGKSIPIVAVICVLAICTVASLVLLRKAWASIPESFQIAPTEPVRTESRQSKFTFPSPPWMPALRALFAKEVRNIAWFLIFAGIMGMESLGVILIWAWIMVTIMRLKQLDQWLLSLPISRHRLFLSVVLIPLTSFALGSAIRLAFLHGSAEQLIVNLMVVPAMSFLGVFVFETPELIRRSIPRLYVLLLTLTALPGWFYLVWRWFFSLHGLGKLRTTPMDLSLASFFPARLPLLLLNAFAVMGTLYLLTYIGFRRLEVGRRPPVKRIQ
jgi:hypothetical protein